VFEEYEFSVSNSKLVCCLWHFRRALALGANFLVDLGKSSYPREQSPVTSGLDLAESGRCKRLDWRG